MGKAAKMSSSTVRIFTTILALAVLVLLPLPAGAQPIKSGKLDVELDALRPGLVASYRSLGDHNASLTRIDSRPAFSLGHSSPHPRLPTGAFEVEWTGVLLIKDPAPIRFSAFVCGEASIQVDGVTVLQGRGEQETTLIPASTPLERGPGVYKIKIAFRSLANRATRLQIWWQGPSFSREPVPAWQLYHLDADAPPALAREQEIARGSEAVSRLGCARCHEKSFPGIADPPPGPVLADLGRTVNRTWLMDWLENPAKVRPGAHMPALFSADRQGFVERWLVADHLLGAAGSTQTPAKPNVGDHRLGRRMFVSLGCTACHYLPDTDPREQPGFDRTSLTDLNDRLPAEELSAFLVNPLSRYPDGRMPRLPITLETARDIAAYLLLWSKPARVPAAGVAAPTNDEINAVASRLGVRGRAAAARALIRTRRCASCHVGLGPTLPDNVPITSVDDRRGCLSGRTLPTYEVDEATRKALAAYRVIAGSERTPSPYHTRQRLLERSGCMRCHQRDSDRPAPLEIISSTLGGSMLESVPFQRTPRLTDTHQKYQPSALLSAIREGVSGLRHGRYSFRMPAFGTQAETLAQALAESDGEVPGQTLPDLPPPADPTAGSLAGPQLVGFQGYACVSCHLWSGQTLSEPDPGAMGPDLTRVTGRIRREWFDRYLEGPARVHPGTPMPNIFTHGKPATLTSILDGNPTKQRDALWSYLALGKAAPSPKPPPALPIAVQADDPVLVAQIPVRLPDGVLVESICLLNHSGDLVVYDLGTFTLRGAFTSAQLLRNVRGRLRTYTIDGLPVKNLRTAPILRLDAKDKPEAPTSRALHGYDRLADGVRLHWQAQFKDHVAEVVETLRLQTSGDNRSLDQERTLTGIPVGLLPGLATTTLSQRLPNTAPREPIVRINLPDPGKIEGSLERPGYRATAYSRPKTILGDDRIMPSAVSVNPRDGRVFVASMKTGEIFRLDDPGRDGSKARFVNYTHGLFEEALSMMAEPDALYVLHRRNLTKVIDVDGDGVADRFERVIGLPHGVAETYDYGYGLVRDRSGAFVFTYAPYGDRKLVGAGGAIRTHPGKPPQEIGYGFRNPLGWCGGPGGEIFFTDNQGEWVATNKLCHLVEGRFYGFPNPSQPKHTSRPRGKTAVWVPYGWARSINGVAYDNTGGKFGPFAGQFFLAELMFGGAIIRADLELVNGEYQGACFPFWGQGLLGPLTLSFSPHGPLYVGSITEPGWMAQPDRGAVFRIDYTGQIPFEMHSIRVRPQGFRINFTSPISQATAHDPAAYHIEHYRYEYTGAYGSPELDRTNVPIERVEVAADGKSAELFTAPLVKDRVYLIQARGVRSATGSVLVHPAGAYTLNELPALRP
jgi:hypothetical protein